MVGAFMTLPFISNAQDTTEVSISYEKTAKLDKEFETKKEKEEPNKFVFTESHIVHVDKKGKERAYKVVNFDVVFTGTGFMYRVYCTYKNKNYIIGIEASSFAYVLIYEYDIKKEKVKSGRVYY